MSAPESTFTDGPALLAAARDASTDGPESLRDLIEDGRRDTDVDLLDES